MQIENSPIRSNVQNRCGMAHFHQNISPQIEAPLDGKGVIIITYNFPMLQTFHDRDDFLLALENGVGSCRCKNNCYSLPWRHNLEDNVTGKYYCYPDANVLLLLHFEGR